MSKECFAIEVEIPEAICPKFKGRDQFIEEGIAKLFLSNNTTAKEALKGLTVYAVGAGKNAVVVTKASFPKIEAQITVYLNEQFGDEWKLTLMPINI